MHVEWNGMKRLIWRACWRVSSQLIIQIFSSAHNGYTVRVCAVGGRRTKNTKNRTTYDTKYYTIRCSKNGWSVMPHAINNKKKTKETSQRSSSARCVKYYIHTFRLYGIIFYCCIYVQHSVPVHTTALYYDIHGTWHARSIFVFCYFTEIQWYMLLFIFVIFRQCRPIDFRL